ncbi:hypothetical protein BD410DRAFT_305550 [Rickenella mellea]|uniref:Uncharacterized protein n=1 Tax=Rickenella mellea TaxID=50990 RepID=A0A4Y7Q3H8_9AGAM|nr:hypothetical protein BD410DRAFT_305550 [Rickenella mellea]
MEIWRWSKTLSAALFFLIFGSTANARKAYRNGYGKAARLLGKVPNADTPSSSISFATQYSTELSGSNTSYTRSRGDIENVAEFRSLESAITHATTVMHPRGTEDNYIAIDKRAMTDNIHGAQGNDFANCPIIPPATNTATNPIANNSCWYDRPISDLPQTHISHTRNHLLISPTLRKEPIQVPGIDRFQ